MKFQDYIDGSKFILRVDLFTIDHHSYDDSIKVLTREEMEKKVHLYGVAGSLWIFNKPDQVLQCDTGGGSIDVGADVEMDGKMWEFWDHTNQSGTN